MGISSYGGQSLRHVRLPTLCRLFSTRCKKWGFMLERRTARRYPVTALVQYRWKATLPPLESGEGRTQGISTNGVFVVGDAQPPLGAYVYIELFRHDRINELRIWLRGEGVVVRVDSEGRPDRGFAASLRTVSINSTQLQ